MGTRDDMCGMDVAQMEDLGGISQELTVYGCAYKVHDEILYRITDDANEAYQFYESAERNGILPTLPEIYTYRTIIPAGQREAMIFETKKACARLLRDNYNATFWQIFDTYNEAAASDYALPVLRKWQQKLEGHYARESLNLYEIFLEECFARHQLTRPYYQSLTQWIAENRERMVDDWIVKERYERTFFGFAYYETSGNLHCQIDTEPFNLLLKQQEKRLQNFYVTPILSQTLQYKENRLLPSLRRYFSQWLEYTLQQWALPLEDFLQQEKKKSLFESTAEQQTLSEPACRTLNYYQKRWHLS